MAKQRPVNLNLFTIKFPIPAIVSILHRISGFILFLCIPFLLWLLQISLSSINHFDELQAFLGQPLVTILVWGVLAALFFHLVAGIRHLLMDLGFGESLKAGRFSAWAVVILSIALTLIAGVWLWQSI